DYYCCSYSSGSTLVF
nr:immunoglobulin light chain junction region [Macaca mulatta]MOX70069.1 immunoglobulin light chain junction region [Macaca mulatta]MOX71711.1 immunoglobulin light chain junction region [Macaca mulatta]MOX72181.1 immunoglobulin light chain junction region [Macaca mulatta]MOX72312.1 immunoglobulin light chain junction region [Macaca mulatta]